MKLTCSKCGCERHYYGALKTAAIVLTYCRECKEYVLHKVEDTIKQAALDKWVRKFKRSKIKFRRAA